MKKAQTILLGVWIVALCGACGGKSDEFLLKGKFRNLREGEFYAYNLEAGGTKLDTIKIHSGEFQYHTVATRPATFVLIYPNFSEQVVFGQNGQTATLKADANALRKAEINGTDENDEMTRFRLDNIGLKEEQMARPAAEYIKAHPTSRVSTYLFYRYFVQAAESRPAQTATLFATLRKAQPHSDILMRIASQINGAARAEKGKTLPAFSVQTTDKKTLKQADLKGKPTVVCFWAAWEDESRPAQRKLREWKKKYGSRLNLLSVSLDTEPQRMKESARIDSLDWNSVCDYRAWDTPLVRTFGVAKVPFLILTDAKQKVIWRGNKVDEAAKELEKIMK